MSEIWSFRVFLKGAVTSPSAGWTSPRSSRPVGPVGPVGPVVSGIPAPGTVPWGKAAVCEEAPAWGKAGDDPEEKGAGVAEGPSASTPKRGGRVRTGGPRDGRGHVLRDRRGHVRGGGRPGTVPGDVDQRGAQGGRVRPLGGFPGEQAKQDRGDRPGVVQGGSGRRRTALDRGVQGRAERPQVGGRAGHALGGGEERGRQGGGGERDLVVRAEQHRTRPHVTVEHALHVHGHEPVQHGQADHRGLLRGHRPEPGDHLLQRALLKHRRALGSGDPRSRRGSLPTGVPALGSGEVWMVHSPAFCLFNAFAIHVAAVWAPAWIAGPSLLPSTTL
ncbi:hypothetical protein GCM10017559_09910 [Streptosporangium longisporum]|uniref:Uncharacterized protein n=1 Tax=Streptosporangium longisporum TaxID=46187 RepID=A0ABP6KBZ5_9ACTN